MFLFFLTCEAPWLSWSRRLARIFEDDGAGLPNGIASDGEQAGRAGLNGKAVDGRPRAGGQGLALHSTMMAIIGGTLSVESAPAQYTRVILALPA